MKQDEYDQLFILLQLKIRFINLYSSRDTNETVDQSDNNKYYGVKTNWVEIQLPKTIHYALISGAYTVSWKVSLQATTPITLSI